MRIRTQDLTEGKLNRGFEQPAGTFPVLAELVETGVCEFLAPIKAALSVQQIGDIVEIEGNISTSIRMACGRCLQSFEMPLESQFALTYSQKDPVPEPSGAGEEELELTADEMGMVYYQGEEINLAKEIQEQVVLAFPLRALCRPDCRGLCHLCGADLNTAACDCDHSPSGGKFEALKDVKLK